MFLPAVEAWLSVLKPVTEVFWLSVLKPVTEVFWPHEILPFQVCEPCPVDCMKSSEFIRN